MSYEWGYLLLGVVILFNILLVSYLCISCRHTKFLLLTTYDSCCWSVESSKGHFCDWDNSGVHRKSFFLLPEWFVLLSNDWSDKDEILLSYSFFLSVEVILHWCTFSRLMFLLIVNSVLSFCLDDKYSPSLSFLFLAGNFRSDCRFERFIYNEKDNYLSFCL